MQGHEHVMHAAGHVWAHRWRCAGANVECRSMRGRALMLNVSFTPAIAFWGCPYGFSSFRVTFTTALDPAAMRQEAGWTVNLVEDPQMMAICTPAPVLLLIVSCWV